MKRRYALLSPEDRHAIAEEAAQIARSLDYVLPRTAQHITDLSRSAVYEFMAAHPNACVEGADGRKRVSIRWLNAHASGRHALAAMERGAAA